MSDADKFEELLVIISNADIKDPVVRRRAESLIESIGALGSRNRAWSELSRAAAKRSSWEMSERAASQITDAHSRSIALMKLAFDQQIDGELVDSKRLLGEAEYVAKQVTDPEEKSWGLYLLVGTLIDCNELASAERIAESINDAYDQGSALNRIADFHIKAQRSEEALKALLKAQTTIENGEALAWAKGEVLCRTAKGMLKLGDKARGIELLQRATLILTGGEVAEGLNGSSDRASVLREIIQTLELAGEPTNGIRGPKPLL